MSSTVLLAQLGRRCTLAARSSLAAAAAAGAAGSAATTSDPAPAAASTSDAGATAAAAASPPVFDTTGDPEEASKCTALVDSAFRTCPKIQLMRDALAKLGHTEASDFVTCAHCPDGSAAAGGYLPDRRMVVLCQQWVARAPGEVENTIVHEMIHAYDHARAFLDWNDLTQHACTEIRAAHLSGDCSLNRELNRGNITPLSFSSQGARCVRRRAQLSVAMHPGCPDEKTARLAVDRAWASCYADRAPFDEHPRGQLVI